MTIRRVGADSPQISVCIPTFDAGQPRVNRLIASLEAHTHVPFETVVADCEGQQRGYTAPQNEAVAAARADIIVAANDDVVVRGSWTAPMLEALEAGAPCVTPDMTHCDGPQVFAPYFMMWRQTDWQHLGGLDERFVLWASDIDLARRLADTGRLPVRVILTPPLWHEGSETTRENPAITPHFNEVSMQDLERFRDKWGVTAEQEKGRLAQLALAAP